ncbi:MAG: diaminopimelate epimerase [Gammaproteobacteria bacterium]|nr:diaminopimelate epimerase [Gammaproteobacteria bacterium]MDH5511880.1 diaminopimelate epimerase [Gammaproteobacteria bacterium]
MPVPFTKMHGAGNDFVVFDGVSRPVRLTPEKIRRIADRHYGIGCDQVLLVEPPVAGGADFRYRIFNADGGEVEQCGNGARCFVHFVRDKRLTTKDEMAVETLSGMIYPRLEPDGRVSVNMGVPRMEPEEIPFEANAREIVYDLKVDGRTVSVSVVSLGNPHAVQVVPDVDAAPVNTQGPQIERHPRFPKRVNAGYMQILDRRHIRLRVFERGAGETLACGSGACAAVVTGRQRGLLDDKVEVKLPGGTLQVFWAGEGQPVWMTGPAVTVFEGTIDLDSL